MNRNLLDQNIPKSIFTISKQALVVFVMAVTTVIFITIFRPFRIYESLDFLVSQKPVHLIDSTEDAFYLAMTSVVLLGSLMVLCSRIILVKSMREKLSYRGFLLWCGLEFVVVALGITIWSSALFHPGSTGIFSLFLKVLGRTTCILFIPYVFCWLYIIIIDKASQLKALRESLDKDEVANQKAHIILYDDHNEMRLTVKREDMVMIESADNYLCVWYLNNEQIKKTMIRNTMKRVAEQLSDSCMQRCHRSYMINMDRVKILRRDKEGVFIEFGIDGVFDVPISKTYLQNITEWLMK
ncbi:MAG: LytTR family transcriptional regulator [Alistipes sp.]|nr:LytTR family transcriptional regulator [Alistipes sp.]MBQ8854090.1 LytTR family transcriptional regulator [Alistipes sp.]